MSHRLALVLLGALLAAFLAPVLTGGVIFPHDNGPEVGAPRRPPEDGLVNNRRFSDLSSVYVPELHAQLHGDHAGWLHTWNPHVELGRPSPHTFGLTRAFYPTLVLSWGTDSAFRLYSWLTALTLALTGLFTYLLLRELGLVPVACLLGAAGAATGPFVVYWASFVMFASTFCWSACLLWLVARWARRPSAATFVGLAFAAHALVLTGYPQQVVHHVYLLAAWALACLLRGEAGTRARLSRAAGLAAAVALGLASTWPVLSDLLVAIERSTRADFGREYFLSGLPDLGGWPERGRFAARLVDAFWGGNPIRPQYREPFLGVSFTPLYAALAFLSLAGPGRRAWGWQVFAALALAATAWPPLYGFAVDRLGFDVSRFVPLASAWLPVMVLAALAADRALRAERGLGPLGWTLGLAPLVLALGGRFLADDLPPLGPLAVTLAVTVAALAALHARRAAWLVPVVLAVSFVYGFRLWLVRPEGSIHVTSPLVESVRAATADGSRHAVVGGGVLPPNQEALLGLRSIHAFDSIAPRAYQELTRELDRGGAVNLGRNFPALDARADLASPTFARSGVSTLVTAQPLDPARWSRLSDHAGVGVWRALTPPPLERQLVGVAPGGGGEVSPAGSPPSLPVTRRAQRDDRLAFDVTRSPETTLLRVSAQHHPHWRAFSPAGELEIARVDGFYLGVWLPPGTESVELAFLPRVLWSWVPQLGYVLAAAALVARRAAQGMRASSASAAR